MRIFGNLVAVLVMIAVVLGFWVYTLVDRASLRYRLTYEVEVPSGEIKSGSSVVQIDWENTEKLPLPNTGAGHEVTGEAVVVDLGQGKHLFSLLKGVDYKGNPNQLVQEVFRPLNVSSPRMELLDFIRYLNETKPKTRLDHFQLPLLVTFTDINDPVSLRMVVPDDLAASFGAGYALKSITLEITDEPLTSGRIEGVFGWWENLTMPIGGDIKRKYGDPLYGLGKSEFRRD